MSARYVRRRRSWGRRLTRLTARVVAARGRGCRIRESRRAGRNSRMRAPAWSGPQVTSARCILRFRDSNCSCSSGPECTRRRTLLRCRPSRPCLGAARSWSGGHRRLWVLASWRSVCSSCGVRPPSETSSMKRSTRWPKGACRRWRSWRRPRIRWGPAPSRTGCASALSTSMRRLWVCRHRSSRRTSSRRWRPRSAQTRSGP